MARIDRRAVLLGLGAVAAGGTSLAGTGTAPSYDDPDSLYAALRSQPGQDLKIGGGTITIVFADGAPGLARGPVLSWIRTAAMALTAYFGRFPVRDYGLLIIAEPGDRVGHATTYGYAGSATRIHVGRDAGRAAFDRDWVLVHELVHSALPDLPRRALWLQEGNATYVEPIARAQIGQLSPQTLWKEAVAGMAQGNPQPGDAGMDGTQAWRRLYWGGALFWLLAEIGIYRATNGTRSLRDALRRINSVSGGNTASWSPEHLMMVGDAAIGATTLIDLYTRFATTAVSTNLVDLFQELGVAPGADGEPVFDNRAPLAKLRERITARDGDQSAA
ncbi:hypothetical protein [Sphingomonas sp. PAMC 26617]|uniref:hypothetical protein n=1 Tax=Sphingomonas sp. PAMC 26617 TaxID=1112216 RepID=UPI000287C506|nr:hypothetical protein [Sphingomonas sp. PAMC 26617]